MIEVKLDIKDITALIDRIAIKNERANETEKDLHKAEETIALLKQDLVDSINDSDTEKLLRNTIYHIAMRNIVSASINVQKLLKITLGKATEIVNHELNLADADEDDGTDNNSLPR